MEAFKIKNLNFSYPESESKALDNVNITIENGEFITICGKSGSGKSTFLRQLKTVLTPHGETEGEIYFLGQLLQDVSDRQQTSDIGYVLQSPENQIVTDKVWHELAFGLESLGYDSETIRLRVAEMASFFGIHTWFHKKVTELSGGQKQILNLASVMTMQPKVLILDEPTSQLDPIAASDFMQTVKKINTDLGTTIIMTEHRLEDIIPISDRLVVMDKGGIISDDIPEVVGDKLHKINHPMFHSMTSAMQIYKGVENDLTCPITVNEGRNWIDKFMDGKDVNIEYINTEVKERPKEVAIRVKDVWFKYERNLPDTIKDLSLDVREGEFYAIVGGNGTGKTTALSIINGINKAYRGKVKINSKNIVQLPQNPQNLFVKKTVELDLYEMLSGNRLSEEEKSEKVEEIVKLTELEHLLNMHPYDLSGGEQQRAALAKVLLLDPEILLLDEPTKGLDNFFKETLSEILKSLTDKGVTIVMVSHDIEFCSKYADICSMFFDGSVITTNDTKKFFAGNSFYTTSSNRIARHICKELVTVEDVIEICQKNK